ncbi:hypothetical protein GCM10010121_069300 [Streptomyces brasiliensis]|uniref:Globin domain-containing protein n=1 Tax=Streptomyces brasiliensis TaxID=1954 RepID=A0A917L6M1_9ACTN|nr:hypothetical protein GCM10010121_069300 [Streptomyces brasiliensis]
MLSPESAAVIRATLPAVGGALDDITTRFYATMFGEQPELLDGLFNRGNQASGEQRKALAGSIAAFAQALLADPDSRPDELLARIAHKHAALGVTEDQYTIVHKYLFRAIGDVLGDAVTPEVAAAWDEVFWLMAGALIAQEARLYQQAQVDPRKPWRQWTVVERREETADVAPAPAVLPATGRFSPHRLDIIRQPRIRPGRARAAQRSPVRRRAPSASGTKAASLRASARPTASTFCSSRRSRMPDARNATRDSRRVTGDG